MLSHTDPSEGQWLLSPLNRRGDEALKVPALGNGEPCSLQDPPAAFRGGRVFSLVVFYTPRAEQDDPAGTGSSLFCVIACDAGLHSMGKAGNLKPGALPRPLEAHLGAFREPPQGPRPSPCPLAEWTSVQIEGGRLGVGEAAPPEGQEPLAPSHCLTHGSTWEQRRQVMGEAGTGSEPPLRGSIQRGLCPSRGHTGGEEPALLSVLR